MHIPDGYLTPIIAGTCYIISIIILYLSWRKYLKGPGIPGLLSDLNTRISYLSVIAAAIFAAQMLNWPIPGGTSAHLVAGALAGMILGPSGGACAMSLVLLVQCLIFGDGGITALGANILNMAIIDVYVGYIVAEAASKIFKDKGRGVAFGSFLGGWLGITLAAIACGVEIGLSPAFGYPLSVTVPVMGVWHAALGLVEGAITMFVISYLSRLNPELVFVGGAT